MPRKKLLVENARAGLNTLRQHVLNEMQVPPESYREQFRTLARQRVLTAHHQSEEAKGPRRRPNH